MRYLILILLISTANAGEVAIANEWCANIGGVFDRKLTRQSDGTYPDCITEAVAYEVGYVGHWEDIGQAYHYARMTGKEPGVALIVETDADIEIVLRLSEDLRYMKDGRTIIVIIDRRL